MWACFFFSSPSDKFGPVLSLPQLGSILLSPFHVLQSRTIHVANCPLFLLPAQTQAFPYCAISSSLLLLTKDPFISLIFSLFFQSPASSCSSIRLDGCFDTIICLLINSEDKHWMGAITRVVTTFNVGLMEVKRLWFWRLKTGEKGNDQDKPEVLVLIFDLLLSFFSILRSRLDSSITT